jgi:hypothetical protein
MGRLGYVKRLPSKRGDNTSIGNTSANAPPEAFASFDTTQDIRLFRLPYSFKAIFFSLVYLERRF